MPYICTPICAGGAHANPRPTPSREAPPSARWSCLLAVMDNLDAILHLQLFANPGAQRLHRVQIQLAEQLLENVEAGVVRYRNNPLRRCLRRSVAYVRQRNPKLVLAVRGPKSP